MFSGGPHHTDEQVLDDQQKPIYNSSVQIQNVVGSDGRWMARESQGNLCKRHDIMFQKRLYLKEQHNQMSKYWEKFSIIL